MPWLLITAAGGIGAWLGSLTGAAVANVTSPAAPQEPPYGTIFLYAAGGVALAVILKKTKVI